VQLRLPRGGLLCVRLSLTGLPPRGGGRALFRVHLHCECLRTQMVPQSGGPCSLCEQ
jgi:hypothetical protein